MQWSKLKQRIEERFADSVAARVAVYRTRYRESANGEDSRGWFVVDAKAIANFSSLSYADLSFDPQIGAYVSRASEMYRFVEAMNRSLSLSIEEMVVSENAIIRALAMLDRRLGKRRLRALTLADDELPLVRTLYDLRCEAEGLTE